ncbi:dual specificity protein phosphatase MPK-4-like [Rhodnius prolixus]|uniref:dual specificity protein phosphatase MPK-4-like n=1 Tax=Rhodnius prolixus TaxID=13249 RepID=UPI003D18C1C6
MENLEKQISKKQNAILLREDFDAGPSNLDRIEPGLWLGNLTAAMDLEILEQIKCNHILTVDSCPLPKNMSVLPGIKTKFIQITDMPKEDLLSHFQGAFDFIKTGQENGVVLVHCYFGVSRSSTIVIAYIMKKYEISYEEAFERVKSKRKYVCPNAGFEAQLKLYETMHCSIEENNWQYILFRLRIAAAKVRQVKILPTECMSVIKPDPALITVRPDPLVYRCCKCRRIVASARNILPHEIGRRMSWKRPFFDPQKAAASGPNEEHNEKGGEQKVEHKLCNQIYFVEPLAWMKTVAHSEQGQLNCPKCDSKLGSFSWIMGCQCPCGSKVAPAFYLVPSKVEWSNMVKNIQVTL